MCLTQNDLKLLELGGSFRNKENENKKEISSQSENIAPLKWSILCRFQNFFKNCNISPLAAGKTIEHIFSMLGIPMPIKIEGVPSHPNIFFLQQGNNQIYRLALENHEMIFISNEQSMHYQINPYNIYLKCIEEGSKSLKLDFITKKEVKFLYQNKSFKISIYINIPEQIDPSMVFALLRKELFNYNEKPDAIEFQTSIKEILDYCFSSYSSKIELIDILDKKEKPSFISAEAITVISEETCNILLIEKEENGEFTFKKASTTSFNTLPLCEKCNLEVSNDAFKAIYDWVGTGATHSLCPLENFSVLLELIGFKGKMKLNNCEEINYSSYLLNLSTEEGDFEILLNNGHYLEIFSKNVTLYFNIIEKISRGVHHQFLEHQLVLNKEEILEGNNHYIAYFHSRFEKAKNKELQHLRLNGLLLPVVTFPLVHYSSMRNELWECLQNENANSYSREFFEKHECFLKKSIKF